MPPFFLQEMLHAALFYDPTVIQDYNFIRVLDSAQSMRYDDGSPVTNQLFDRILDDIFRFQVDAGGRFIEYQNIRIKNEQPHE